MIRIVIVDDHQVVREGLKMMLELEKDMIVIDTASSGVEAIEIIDKCNPDLIFMDIKMNGISGIETTRILRDKYPGIKIIMLTIYSEIFYINKAIQAGANGYVSKNAGRSEIIEVIWDVYHGKNVLGQSLTENVFEGLKDPESTEKQKTIPKLTERELDILSCLVSGRTDQSIADHLHISPHTARTHIKSIYRKLRVTSRSQAIVIAIKNGLVEME